MEEQSQVTHIPKGLPKGRAAFATWGNWEVQGDVGHGGEGQMVN